MNDFRDEMPALTELLSEPKLTQLLRTTEETSIGWFLSADSPAHRQWRTLTNEAIELMLRQCSKKPDLIRKYAARIADHRQTISALSELHIGHKLHNSQWGIDWEPKGSNNKEPDFHISKNGQNSFVEVYTPIYTSADFDWEQNFKKHTERTLKELAIHLHVGIRFKRPGTSPDNKLINRAIKNELPNLLPGQTFKLVVSSTGAKLEKADDDSLPGFDASDGDILFVADIGKFTDPTGLVTSTHDSRSHYSAINKIGGLNQLQKNQSNILAVSTGHDFLTEFRLKAKLEEVFKRHKNLSGAILFDCSIYHNMSTEYVFRQYYEFIESTTSDNPISTPIFSC